VADSEQDRAPQLTLPWWWRVRKRILKLERQMQSSGHFYTQCS